MFGGEMAQFLSEEFLVGWMGGVFITSILTLGFISYVQDKIQKPSLRKWQKVACAFGAAFMVSLAWGLYNGGIDWSKIPGTVIIYGTVSGFVWNNIVKPFADKLKAAKE
jgi:Mg/Co/Ni transporter MgtE